MVIFTLEENGSEQSFRGVVEEFRAKRRRDDSIERKHLVVFDDGESKWLDLAAEEKSENLGWMSLPEASTTAALDSTRETESSDMEEGESLASARNVITPAASFRNKQSKRLSTGRDSTQSREDTQKRSGGIRNIQIPGSSSSEPERANKRSRRNSNSPSGMIRHRLLDDESNTERSRPCKLSEGIKQLMTSQSTKGKHLLFRKKDREHMSKLNYLAGQQFWFFRQLQDPERDARYFFCVHCGHQRRCRSAKDLSQNFHQLRRHLESCKSAPREIRAQMETTERLRRATNWTKVLGKRWNTDLGTLDGEDLLETSESMSDTSMSTTETVKEATTSDEESEAENDGEYDRMWDFIKNGKVSLAKMYQVMKTSTDDAITRAFVRFEAPSREFRVRKIANVVDRFVDAGFDLDFVLESMEAVRKGKSLYSFADEVTKFQLEGSNLALQRVFKKPTKSLTNKQVDELKSDGETRDVRDKTQRTHVSAKRLAPSHRGRVSQEDIIGDFTLSRPEDREYMSELNYAAGEQFYFCKEVDCEDDERFLVCIHCLRSRSLRSTKDLIQNFHQYVKRHVEVCKNVPDTVKVALEKAVKSSTHWNFLSDRWHTDLCVLKGEGPTRHYSTEQQTESPPKAPEKDFPPDYLKTWDFVRDGKVPLIKMHFVMNESTDEQIKLAFKQLGSSLRQWRVKKIMRAIADFVRQGYSVDTVLELMEADRGKKSLYSYADEIHNFRIKNQQEPNREGDSTEQSPTLSDVVVAPTESVESKEDRALDSQNDQEEPKNVDSNDSRMELVAPTMESKMESPESENRPLIQS